jgi:2-polyprenyl-3-methyl-5-hydroxy-6-metoxy-1,4-benzoquinol methylase
VRSEDARCPNCRSLRGHVHLVGRDLSQGLPGEYTLIRCEGCGLTHLNPMPREIRSLYTENYDQFTPALSDVPRIQRLVRRYGLRKRVNAILRYKRTGRLLDIGCATGDFLDEMRKCPGWRVRGVEPCAGAAVYARNRVGLDVVHGYVSDISSSDGGYDVITLWNVLEHLPDPLESAE